MSADTIKESVSGGGGSAENGLQVFAISGANFDFPFDPSSGVPSSASGSGFSSATLVSTSNPNDIVFGAVQQYGSIVPVAGSGFTVISSAATSAPDASGYATEYENATGVLTNFPVAFWNGGYTGWQEIADAVEQGNVLTQVATPPSQLYVNVNATYPYVGVKMRDMPVGLEAYTSYLAYSRGGPLSSTASGGFTVYALPVPADFGQVCFDSACNNPAANVAVYLYNGNGQNCGYSFTNNRGIVSLNATGSTSTCTYPYYSAAITTSGTSLRLTEVFRTETISNPSPFYTNFQGYNYALYAPQRTGRYLLHMFTFFSNSTFTMLYPSTSYPDVQYPYLTCCDIILNVMKHPLQVQTSFNPGIATVLDKTNATIQLTDLATSKPLASSAFNYTIVETLPVSGTIASGVLTTNSNGTATLNIGLRQYGNYTLIVSRSATSTINAVSNSFSFTVYKAKPTLIITLAPTLDGSAQAFCSNATSSCSTPMGPTLANDIIIAFAFETLDVSFFSNSCTFSVSDTAGLSWRARSGVVFGRYENIARDQLQEFWARSTGLSSDTITESISGCGNNYNGLQVFAISRANFNSPFDPASGLPASASGYGTGTSVTLSTSDPNDFVFAAVQHGSPPVPTAQPGFTIITSGGGVATEYNVFGSVLSNFAVTFGDTATDYWEEIGDAVRAGSATIQNATAGQTYTFTTNLVNNATGSVIAAAGLAEKVYVNNALGSYTTSSGGNITFSWTPATAGQYNITTSFDPQSFYTASKVTVVIPVARRSAILATNFSPLTPDVNQTVTWNVVAYDLINNATVKSLQVSQYIDGVLKTTNPTDSSGTATFTYAFTSIGYHNVTFVSAQNGTYNSARSYGSLTVFIKTTLTLQGGTVILGQQNTFTVTLIDASGTAIQGRLVRIEINSAFYQNVTTDSNGQTHFTWRPDNTGSYTIFARFSPTSSSDQSYRSSATSIKVAVAPLTTVNTTSSSSGTQSISLNIAQGVTQTPSGATFSVSFPTWDTFVITVQLGITTLQGTAKVSNDLGWNCVARVWGACVLSLPYWNVRIDFNVPNAAQARLILPILSLDPMTTSYSVQGQGQIDRSTIAFGEGLAAGAITIGAFLVPMLLARAPGTAQIAAAAYVAGMGVALPLVELLAFTYPTKTERINFAAGILTLAALEFGTAEVVTLLTGIVRTTIWPDVRTALAIGWGIGLLWAVMFFSIYSL